MASRSEVRAVKRRRWERETDPADPSYVSGELLPVPAGPHAPNGREAHMLRRLMAQTGMTEEQLREHKCYRVQLSTAQKAQGTKSRMQRVALRVRKKITRELQLPREHPSVKAAFLAAWPDYCRPKFVSLPTTAHDAWNAVLRLR